MYTPQYQEQPMSLQNAIISNRGQSQYACLATKRLNPLAFLARFALTLCALFVLALPGQCGTTFFTADDPTNGRELWKTDGSTNGTVLVRDIASGSFSSNPGSLTAVGSTLFFAAETSGAGNELWKSDGTTNGTVMVRDIYPGLSNSNPTALYNANGILYFSAFTNGDGQELWRSDGTTNGTYQLLDIYAGNKSSFPRQFLLVNNQVFFTATTASGEELWRTDGTTNGTFMVKDINTSSGLGSNPSSLIAFGTRVLFQAQVSSLGTEPWISDGTSAGTALIQDIFPGATSGVSNVNPFVLVGNTAYFQASTNANGTELWKTDGTGAGTMLVKDIRPGSASSEIRNLVNFNGTLFFVANDGNQGLELWKSDGTTAGTIIVRDINPGSPSSSPQELKPIGKVLYFSAADASGSELWKSDGTEAGTVLVRNINTSNGQGSSPASLTEFKTRVLFRAQTPNTGDEPWISDGSEAGTVLLNDTRTGVQNGVSGFSLFYVNGRVAYFAATTSATGNELWKTDGTPNGTNLLRDINTRNSLSSNPAQFVYVNTSADKTSPTLTITTPTDNAVLTDLNSISGTAVDNSGGTGFTEDGAFVLITLGRNSDNAWWNGNSWEANVTWLPTTLSNTGISCNWTSNFNLPSSWGGGRYMIYARAYDGAGNPSNTDTARFTITSATPTITIATPAHNSNVDTLATISGTTAAGAGGGSVNSINVFIRRGSDNFYWNGTAWVSGRVGRAATRSGSNWSITGGPTAAQMTAGAKYYLAAYVTNTAGGQSSTGSNVTFSSDSVPPTVAFTSPTDGAAVTTLETIQGTAADNVALRKVDVYLRRGTDSFYWNGTAWVSGRAGRTSILTGSNWSLVGGPTLAQLAPGMTYYLAATVTDAAGLTGSTGIKVSIARTAVRNVPATDITAPSVSIESPFNGSNADSLGTIAGTATDAKGGSGLASVEVTIRRGSDNAYWSGTGWATKPTNLTTTLSRANWAYAASLKTLEPGVHYTITAVATDGAGNTGSDTITVRGNS
jgi:ELWxxDGT repeat protein